MLKYLCLLLICDALDMRQPTIADKLCRFDIALGDICELNRWQIVQGCFGHILKDFRDKFLLLAPMLMIDGKKMMTFGDTRRLFYTV